MHSVFEDERSDPSTGVTRIDFEISESICIYLSGRNFITWKTLVPVSMRGTIGTNRTRVKEGEFHVVLIPGNPMMAHWQAQTCMLAR